MKRKKLPAGGPGKKGGLFFIYCLLLAGFFGFGHAVLADDICNSNIVISEIYGGGGNSGAIYKNDFIELYNNSTTDINLDGWSVQYAPSTSVNFSVTPLSGAIKAGKYYLIQEKAGAGGTQDLPVLEAFPLP